MTAWMPRQRRPYLDACPLCSDSPRIPPVVLTDGDPVVADYLCAVGHMWSTGWERDADHDRWAAK